MSTKYLSEFFYQPPSLNRFRLRKNRKRIKIVIFLGLFLAILIIIWRFSRIGFFSFKEIELIGKEDWKSQIVGKTNEFISTSQLLKFSSFLINSQDLKSYLQSSVVEINIVKVKKEILKRKLIITAEEKKEVGIICQNLVEQNNDNLNNSQKERGVQNLAIDGAKLSNSSAKSCFWFDENGLIFKEAPQFSGSIILAISDERQGKLILGSKILTSLEIQAFIDFKNQAKKILNLEINKFIIRPGFYPDLIAQSVFGFNIYFENQNYESAIINLKQVLEKKLQGFDLTKINYFDIRLDNRIYFK